MAEGVKRVNQAPGQRAAQKQEKMRQRLVESIDSGKWAENTAAVPLDEWKERMLSKGVGRVAAGVDASAGKMANALTQIIDHQEQIQRELESMPDLTLEDSIARMTHQVRRMSELKVKRG